MHSSIVHLERVKWKSNRKYCKMIVVLFQKRGVPRIIENQWDKYLISESETVFVLSIENYCLCVRLLERLLTDWSTEGGSSLNPNSLDSDRIEKADGDREQWRRTRRHNGPREEIRRLITGSQLSIVQPDSVDKQTDSHIVPNYIQPWVKVNWGNREGKLKGLRNRVSFCNLLSIHLRGCVKLRLRYVDSGSSSVAILTGLLSRSFSFFNQCTWIAHLGSSVTV